MKKHFKIIIVLIVALVIRILWAYIVQVEPVSDSIMYNTFARTIASGQGYAYPDGRLTAYWPVGTSAVYAFLYLVFGHSFISIVILNIILGTSIVWITYAVSLMYFNKRIALISAAAICFWPLLIQYTTILASELIFIFVFLSAVFIWGQKQISLLPRCVLWGVLICAASFIRPIAYTLLVIFPLIYWIKTRDLRKATLRLSIGVLTAALLFSPWVYRNYKLFNGFVLVATNDGVNLWMGNNPAAKGGYMPLPEKLFSNEFERNKLLKKKAVTFILNNPVDYLKLSVKRFFITYKSETIGVVWNQSYLEKVISEKGIRILKIISTLYWWIILLSGLTGMILFIRKNKFEIFNPLTIVTIYFFMIPLLTVGQDRYHMPLIPFLAIFFAFTVNLVSRKVTVNEKITL